MNSTREVMAVLAEKEGLSHSILEWLPKPELTSVMEVITLAGGNVRIGATLDGTTWRQLIILL